MVKSANRNRVVQAALRQDQEDRLEGEALGEDGFDPMVEELTTDDVLDDMEEMPARQRAEVMSTRKRGQASRGHVGHKEQTAHVDAHEEDFEPWRPTNSLDAPPALPGMEQRWIRFMSGPDNDPQNWSRAMRGRWVPRPLSTVPDTFSPPVQKTHLGEVIAVNDVILCHRDRRIGLSRRKYFRELQKKQALAAKRHFRKVETAEHPITEYDPDIAPTVGRGRRPQVQDE
jgi:hypothetical protein